MLTESAKYQKIWDRPEYRITAPGEYFVDEFLSLARPVSNDSIIDFGCGTGRAALQLAWRTPATVIAMDFADNCLDDDVRANLGGNLSFERHDLTQPIGHLAMYGFCTDVMEHIPPQDVDKVLGNICQAAIKVYFNISTVQDHMGALIGEALHLTVEPMQWWKEKLESLGFRIDYSKDLGQSCVFWGSVYANGADVSEKTGLNVSEDRIRENMLKNLELGLQEICPHQVQDQTIYVLAGGPSLNDYEQEIIEIDKTGAPIVTVNGTYQWLLDRGIRPAAHFMVDGREFNERFVTRVVDSCKYIFSSQAAHEVVCKTPKEQTWLYHSGDSDLAKEVFEQHCKKIGKDMEWYPIVGGTTVVSRGLIVLAMLGFRKIVVYGWDSCLRGEAHHAYSQPENDSQAIIEVIVGGKRFKCHPWMVVQAHEFPKLVKHLFAKIDGFELDVRGDGLIAHLLEHAAQLGKGV